MGNEDYRDIIDKLFISIEVGNSLEERLKSFEDEELQTEIRRREVRDELEEQIERVLIRVINDKSKIVTFNVTESFDGSYEVTLGVQE